MHDSTTLPKLIGICNVKKENPMVGFDTEMGGGDHTYPQPLKVPNFLIVLN